LNVVSRTSHRSVTFFVSYSTRIEQYGCIQRASLNRHILSSRRHGTDCETMSPDTNLPARQRLHGYSLERRKVPDEVLDRLRDQ
jgi:hypothetical protein